MLELGRFCAWVTIEDVEASEYCVEVSEDGESVTCWVASEVDKSFVVHWKDTMPQDGTNGHVRVDGAYAGGRTNRIGRYCTLDVSGTRTSNCTERPLIFSRTEYTDDDAYLDQLSPDHGSITLRIDQVNITKESQEPSSAYRFEPYKTTKVHEQSKKFLHSIQLGSERPVTTTWTTTEIIRKAVAFFTFKYRPIELLRDLKIAPAVPPPPSAEVHDNAPSMVHEEVKPKIIEIDTELHELQARMDALKERKNAINQVKREPAIPAFLPGEVIDLT